MSPTLSRHDAVFFSDIFASIDYGQLRRQAGQPPLLAFSPAYEMPPRLIRRQSAAGIVDASFH
jgi:hypothetical protein